MSLPSIRATATCKLTRTLCGIFFRTRTVSANTDNIGWSCGEKERHLDRRTLPENYFGLKNEVARQVELKFDPDAPEHQYPYKQSDGGIKHFMFTYYPRHPDKDDEKLDPSPLHMVRRTKKTSGLPCYHKDILKEFNLYDQKGAVALVPNTPEKNALLWQIKHLVEILPVKLPENMPSNYDQLNPLEFVLREDGTLEHQPATFTLDQLDQKMFSPKEEHDSKWNDAEIRRRYSNVFDLKY